jgi:hypothetical protein
MIQIANPAPNQRIEESGAAFQESFWVEFSEVPPQQRVQFEPLFRRFGLPAGQYGEPVTVCLNSQIEVLIRDHHFSRLGS